MLRLISGLSELTVRVGKLGGAFQAGQGSRSQARQEIEHLGIFVGELSGGVVRVRRQGTHQTALVQQWHRDGGAHTSFAGRCLAATLLLIVVQNYRCSSLDRSSADSRTD